MHPATGIRIRMVSVTEVSDAWLLLRIEEYVGGLEIAVCRRSNTPSPLVTCRYLPPLTGREETGMGDRKAHAHTHKKGDKTQGRVEGRG